MEIPRNRVGIHSATPRIPPNLHIQQTISKCSKGDRRHKMEPFWKHISCVGMNQSYLKVSHAQNVLSIKALSYPAHKKLWRDAEETASWDLNITWMYSLFKFRSALYDYGCFVVKQCFYFSQFSSVVLTGAARSCIALYTLRTIFQKMVQNWPIAPRHTKTPVSTF